MQRFFRSSALLVSLVLAGCASTPDTFTTFTHRIDHPTGTMPTTTAPRYTDAIALNYANFVESEFRARADGSRYTREGSNTALAGLSGFTAAAGTLAYSASTVTGLGMASAGMVQLQHIFDAKGRANAYSEAALRIHAAIKDFVAMNLNNVSETQITPNGWTLANLVQANVDMVDKVLNGHLPTPEDMVQATETLSPAGATPQRTGTVPVNNISRFGDSLPTHLRPRTTDKTPPAAQSSRGVAPDVRAGRAELSDLVAKMRKAGDSARARAILARHKPAVAGGADALNVLADRVDVIRTSADLTGWRDAFDETEVTDDTGSNGAKTETGGLPAHQKPTETSGTPTAAPKSR